MLPWGQSGINIVKFEIRCYISTLKQPKNIPNIVFAMGLNQFEQQLPQFSWLPNQCKPDFTYYLEMLDTSIKIPKWLSQGSFVKLMPFNGATEVIQFPTILIDGDKLPSEIESKTLNLKIFAIEKTSGLKASFLQKIQITNDPDSVKVEQDYKVTLTSYVTLINDIGCIKIDSEITDAFSTAQCNLKYLKSQGFTLVGAQALNQLSFDWDKNTVSIINPLNLHDKNLVTIASSKMTSLNIKVFKITFQIGFEIEKNETEKDRQDNSSLIAITYAEDWALKYPKTKELKAKIKSISSMGRVVIEFNQALQLSDINISSISNQTFSIWIDKQSIKQPLSTFNWSVDSFQGDNSIFFQLSFASPLSISINYDDYLNIEILDLSIFKPLQYGRVLLSEPKKTQRMRKLLPRQMKVDALLQSLVGKMQSLMTNVMFGNALINIVLSTSLQTLWGMINALQIVILLPLANLYFPPSTQLIFDMLTHIFNFEFYDLTPYLCKMLQLDPETYEGEPLRPQFSNFGYDLLNSVLNLNNVFATFVVFIFLDLLAMLLARLYQAKQKPFYIITWFDRQVRHNMLARFTLQCFIQLALCAFLNMHDIQFGEFAFGFASVFAIGLLIYLIGFIAFNVRFMRRVGRGLVKKDELILWESLLEGLNEGNRSKIHFNTYYMLRRLYLSIVLIFLQDHPLSQLWLLIFQNLLTLSLLLTHPPFDAPLSNSLELFNECCIALATYHLLAFSDAYIPIDGDEMAATENMGWSLALLVVGQLVVNTLVMVALSIVGNYRKAVAYIKKRMGGGKKTVQVRAEKKDGGFEIRLSPEERARIQRSLKQLKERTASMAPLRMESI
ncbi:hypothetical protein FGO68_gene6575 [Halteria grandinella]|uniref:TRP C-terminal domain-containing protein n=1 Tax=Halteria grandinella TaxID=5974 RepID=A0A8J8T972_HALGN|nr:hypothetical protein FGO68_gene6575 [Halteria grandinella]